MTVHMVGEEAFAKLREPVPPEKIAKQKKEWTDKKTGQRKSLTLDYVNHGVVTDRLLDADPTYSFEPLMDAGGIPIVVTGGLNGDDTVGVWGRLKIAGTEVVEFCSGKDLMDAYSRCLCRAAMRRGVALALWTKENDQVSRGASDGAVTGSIHPTPAPASASSFKPPDVVAKAQAAQEARADREPPADGGNPGDVVIGFGKNQGRKLSDLSAKQIEWYATTWEPNPQFANDTDRRLKLAAQMLHGIGPAEPTEPGGDTSQGISAADDNIPFDKASW